MVKELTGSVLEVLISSYSTGLVFKGPQSSVGLCFIMFTDVAPKLKASTEENFTVDQDMAKL